VAVHPADVAVEAEVAAPCVPFPPSPAFAPIASCTPRP
jgi:hypothetical protein